MVEREKRIGTRHAVPQLRTLLVFNVLHDKWVNGTDTSDQAGVKGGKCIALHIHTLTETVFRQLPARLMDGWIDRSSS